MRTNRLKASIYASACLLVAACGGVGPSEQDPVASERLEISTRDRESGLAGQLRLGDLTQTAFEAYRVPGIVELPDGSQRDYEIVARFVTPDGHTLASIGEGGQVPDSWLPAGPADSIAATTREQVESVARAAHQLATADAGAVSSERDVLVDLGRNIERIFADLESTPDTVDADGPGVLRRGLTTRCGYRQRVSVYEGTALRFWDHTATLTYIFRDCGGKLQLLSSVQRKNHGRGPFDSGMRFKESGSGPTKSRVPTPRRCDFWGYNYAPHTHVCNQDTFIQLGTVLSGFDPSTTTLNRICAYRTRYRAYVGRDSYYRPTLSNAAQYISRYGWGSSIGSGGPAGDIEVTNNVLRMK